MGKPTLILHNGNQRSRAAIQPVDDHDLILERAVLRLHAHILGLILGIILGFGIFIATNFLILKGGKVVGPHLSLLSNFFPFYSVTFVGSIVGFGWGLLCGYLAGLLIAFIYNLVIKIRSS